MVLRATRIPGPDEAGFSVSNGVRVAFHGVRGSTPVAGPGYGRYGGHSSCVTVESEGEAPLVLDLGTGFSTYGCRVEGEFHGSVLLTHLHWDHVMGLPFFVPLHQAESTLLVYGPRQTEGSLSQAFEDLMRPPYFPIRPQELPGKVDFVDVSEDDFPLGQAKVRSRWVRHNGPTLGFRVELGGTTIAYIPDHGQGCSHGDPDDYVPDAVLELCDGVDLLIHDAQHTLEEYRSHRHWGHSTPNYAVRVAREAGAARLVLFHHDPRHTDDIIDDIARDALEYSRNLGGADVIAAQEGLVLHIPPSGTPVTAGAMALR